MERLKAKIRRLETASLILDTVSFIFATVLYWMGRMEEAIFMMCFATYFKK